MRERQDWVLAQLREWYLFPETLPANPNPAAFSTVSDFLDSLTATARSQRRDRFFTYITSIAQENGLINSGASAGFGFRLTLDPGNRLLVAESFEGAPALTAGIDRGAEIVGIGTSTSTVQTVSSLIAAGGTQALNDALGPNTAGTTRVLRVRDASGQRDIAVTKSDFSLIPVSPRYGGLILNNNGQQYGYLNLRTFIVNSAGQQLRDAIGRFRTAGITNMIVDLRYNGGGLVSVGELLGDLLGGNRSTSDVQGYTVFRPEKSSNNTQRNFQPQPESVSPTRIVFITTGSTASASEEVINALIPYYGNRLALVGSNTFGKPVGQIALDRAACDDRLRVVAFQSQNSARSGDYYDGLASKVAVSCQARDDLSTPLGNAGEASIRAAIDTLNGQSCSAITASAGGATPQAATATLFPENQLLQPDQPSPAQREVPGLY
ncbi:MAG: peptidase S41 [Proteobacteria bacterium SG_bin6]|nr:MAG: peptidase S41 [Proteobacteria bacterium SG_bin6]